MRIIFIIVLLGATEAEVALVTEALLEHNIHSLERLREQEPLANFCLLYLKVAESDFEGAKRYINIYPQCRIYKIKELLASDRELPHKSERVAKVLSAVIPGSGQLYCGAIGDAVNVFLLNLLFLYLFKKAELVHDRFVCGSLFLRFYFGGIYHAKRLALQYNQHQKQRLKERLLECLRDFPEYNHPALYPLWEIK